MLHFHEFWREAASDPKLLVGFPEPKGNFGLRPIEATYLTQPAIPKGASGERQVAALLGALASSIRPFLK
jgi:hypothetical protein